MNSAQLSALPLNQRALFVLLLVNCIGIGLIFPAHAFSLPAALALLQRTLTWPFVSAFGVT